MKMSWMLLIILSGYVCDAYKILVIFPFPGKSHGILGQGVVRHLLNAGHEVTFVAPVTNINPHQNLTEIDVTSRGPIQANKMFNIKKALESECDKGIPWTVYLIFHSMTTSVLDHPNIQKLMADQSQKFDLIIAEWMFNELFSGFAALFDAPLIWFSTVEPHSTILSLVDEHLSTAYSVEHGDDIPPFSFAERVTELWLTMKSSIFRETLGSILKSKDMPKEMISKILNEFGSLKQSVIWKFEEELPNVPENVHVLKWAPQQSILAHPNCVLFITHGGLLSITETIHVGVPIIGIPVFGDQFININRAVKKGFAKRVDMTYNIGRDLKAAIDDILSNPTYTKKVKQLSFIYHDRPVKPGVELVHWVEHVINTSGAPHLRSLALRMPWYQKAYLDLFLIVAALIYILRKLIKLLYKVISKRLGTKQKRN